MKPRLYAPTETAFDSNGIGVLSDAKKCIVTTELNGEYELKLQYPIIGIHFGEICQRAIILARPDPVSEPQPFRVYRITKPMLGVVTVYARHVAYDLMGVPVSPFSASDISEALKALRSNAATACPFGFYTDKITEATMTVETPTALWSLLGGSSGSILDVYGGEYEFDRWTVKLWKERGENRGVSVRYGKNLTTLEQNENCANCYTGVYPYWANLDGELVTLPEKILYADGNYDYTSILTLDLSEEWEDAPTETQLQTRTEAYMSANDIGVPSVSWKIEFVNLEKTEEYKELGLLETVLLGDTVSVIFADMGINATARVKETEYDCIMERYNYVTLGSVRSNLAKTIANQGKEIDTKATTTAVAQGTTAMGKVMLGAGGGHIRIIDTDGDNMPDVLYVADHYDPDQTGNVWMFDGDGWSRSTTGYDGDFETVVGLDGTAPFVRKDGDTMTGTLKMPGGSAVYGGSWPTLEFEDTAGNMIGGVQMSDANRVTLVQKETGATYNERYMLPTLTEGRTSEGWYRLLTTKNRIDTAQTDLGVISGLELSNSNFEIPSGADVDTYITPGAYRAATAAIAASLINAPPYTSAGFRLIVSYNSHSASTVQVATFNAANPYIYYRMRIAADTWTNWVKILTTPLSPYERGNTLPTTGSTGQIFLLVPSGGSGWTEATPYIYI